MPKSNYSPQTDWISREKRELFCKAVNSILMTTPETPLEKALTAAKTIVDTAFKNYPDRAEEDAKAENFELNIIEQ